MTRLPLIRLQRYNESYCKAAFKPNLGCVAVMWHGGGAHLTYQYPLWMASHMVCFVRFGYFAERNICLQITKYMARFSRRRLYGIHRLVQINTNPCTCSTNLRNPNDMALEDLCRNVYQGLIFGWLWNSVRQRGSQ